MESKKYHSVGTIPTSKSVDYTVERDTIDTSNAYINDRSISWIETTVFTLYIIVKLTLGLKQIDQNSHLVK